MTENHHHPVPTMLHLFGLANTAHDGKVNDFIALLGDYTNCGGGLLTVARALTESVYMLERYTFMQVSVFGVPTSPDHPGSSPGQRAAQHALETRRTDPIATLDAIVADLEALAEGPDAGSQTVQLLHSLASALYGLMVAHPGETPGDE